MTIAAYIIASAVLVALVYFGVRYFVRAREKFGGGRVIICPETGKQAFVEVDSSHAGLTSLVGQTDIRLESCSRWPINKDCGQECLIQLDVAPPECLVRGVLMKWYRGKHCAFCGIEFTELHVTDHKPTLLDLEGVTREWHEIALSDVMSVMATHKPVCWNCHIAQTFRREHPDLVVERRWLSVSGEEVAAHESDHPGRTTMHQ